MSDGLADAPRLQEAAQALDVRFADVLLGCDFAKGELTVRVRPGGLLAVLRFLKVDLGFSALQDMIGLDRGPAAKEGRKRFAVLYQLYRPADRTRLRISVDADEGEPLDSAVSVWKSADWAEREIFDMFGLGFAGRPDLRRIYLDETFEGHPLRKDFPLAGRSGGL
jgi:NADH-quinone oxidoreductase subunit C